MGTLRTCETEADLSGGAGVGGESTWYSRDKPHARAPKRRDNAENGSGNENRDGGPVGVLRGALEMEAKGQAVQFIDGPGKTGSDSVGDEELGVKRGDD